jgi:ABC-2 type transport system permease protein
MTGAILIETLRRAVWPMLYWGLGLGTMAFISALLVPLFDAIQLAETLRNLPPIVLAAAGLDSNLTALLTPEGIIMTSFFGKFTLLFAAYPVVMGMRVTANEEDEGTLDVLLSLPVPRWRLVLEKFIAYTLTIILIGLMIYGGLWVGVQVSGTALNMQRVADAILHLIPMLIMVLAFTVFIGASIRRRQVALGIVTGFVLSSFMLNTIASMVDGSLSSVLNAVSFFSYFDASAIVQHGTNPAHIAGLLVASGLLFGGALWRFQRRDVGL